MRLEKATYKAIKYSCSVYHYSKSTPAAPFGYSVFNDSNDFCGCIVFGRGANNNMGKPYGLKVGQYVELVRMALNGKQINTSKCLSLSLKLLKKDNPTIKMVISFADTGQNHIGIIYQATNWIFTERVKTTPDYLFRGRWMHQRQINSLLGSLKNLPINTQKRNGTDKLRYIYPLTKELKELCKSLSKPYPKNASIA